MSMAKYHYRAEWEDTLPDPKGLWHIRIYDPLTKCVLICVHSHVGDLPNPPECSLTLVGTLTREEIEVEVIAFVEERESDLAGLPRPLTGTVYTAN